MLTVMNGYNKYKYFEITLLSKKKKATLLF